MRIALAQVKVSPGNLEKNLGTVERTMRTATGNGADLVVFPELMLSGYQLHRFGDMGVDVRDPRILAALAPGGDRTAAVLPMVERVRDETGEHRYNSAVYYEGGRVRHVHRKLSLVRYEPFAEHRRVEEGSTLQAFDTPFGRVAMLICNDAWHPHFPSLAVQDGAELLIVPINSAISSFSTQLDAHHIWEQITGDAETLQAAVVMVNRVGYEDGMHFYGGSRAVDAQGRLVEAPLHRGCVTYVDVDLARIRDLRRDVPVSSNARLDVVVRTAERIQRERAAQPQRGARERALG